jgi:hypothetical protein
LWNQTNARPLPKKKFTQAGARRYVLNTLVFLILARREILQLQKLSSLFEDANLEDALTTPLDLYQLCAAVPLANLDARISAISSTVLSVL